MHGHAFFFPTVLNLFIVTTQKKKKNNEENTQIGGRNEKKRREAKPCAHAYCYRCEVNKWPKQRRAVQKSTRENKSKKGISKRQSIMLVIFCADIVRIPREVSPHCKTWVIACPRTWSPVTSNVCLWMVYTRWCSQVATKAMKRNNLCIQRQTYWTFWHSFITEYNSGNKEVGCLKKGFNLGFEFILSFQKRFTKIYDPRRRLCSKVCYHREVVFLKCKLVYQITVTVLLRTPKFNFNENFYHFLFLLLCGCSACVACLCMCG